MGWRSRGNAGRVRAFAVVMAAAGLAAGCSGSGSVAGSSPASGGAVTNDATTGATGAVATVRAAPSTTAVTSTAVPSTTPTSTLPPVAASGGQPITHGPRDRKAIALTFDSNMTDHMLAELDSGQVASFNNTAVIDELDRLKVPATLFLAGKWMERYPETTRRLAADPLFELGSHSYAHLGYTANCYTLGALPVNRMAADVDRSEQVLRSFAPNATKLFRFPGGCYDQTALNAIRPTGVTVIQYDLASGDAFGTSVSAIVRTVLGHARNGSIVVMHITGGNTAPLTDKALPAIVQGLRARGYTLVTVSQLLAGTGPSA